MNPVYAEPHARPRRRRLRRTLATITTLLFATVAGADDDAPAMDPDLRSKAKRATDEGLHYLREQQAEDGSWSGSVGITALALRGFLESHRGYNESDGAFIERPIRFILGHVNDDGSISETNQNRAYNTAVVLTALAATNNPAYADVIAGGQQFLIRLQIDTEEGYESDHRYYGGVGYGGDERPDLSNAYMALEALAATGLDEDDDVWQRALTFVSRCQNRSESNDQEWAANDGGFTYMPGYSPNGGTGSYGGMTSAGLLSLLFAGTDRDDPRVQAAYNWIQNNYTLDDNPGAVDRQGLFYYYNVFSKSMYAFGADTLTAKGGQARNWRDDLATKLLSLQLEDGAWVNPDSKRWGEGDRNLVTAWTVIALNLAVR